jgi:long-chain acyl-CoA synthetase
MTWLDALVNEPFVCITDMIRRFATERGDHAALICDGEVVTYADLDAKVDRFAAALQRDGLKPCDAIALCATASVEYVVAFLGGLRAGAAVAPLAPSSSAASLVSTIGNSGARLLFLDAEVQRLLEPVAGEVNALAIGLDGHPGSVALQTWLAPFGAAPVPLAIEPAWPFNIIYSSGTTGTPKGIVQSHGMRWAYAQRSIERGYGPHATTLISTPLYSNTTLVSFMPTLTFGGTVVLMSKFDTSRYLALAQQYRATHTMLVPVQYQRLMAHPDFDRYDLSSFQAKFCTSAPFAASVKADVVRRWPGKLTEYYGMTEGGGSCQLEAHAFPDKLHTVGKPVEGHDIRLIDEQGNEVTQGEVGHDDRLLPATGENRRRGMVRPERQALHPHRGYGTLRRGRLSDATRPQEGHDHFGRLQRVPKRSGGGTACASGRCGCSRDRRAVGAMGRNACGVRRTPARSHT